MKKTSTVQPVELTGRHFLLLTFRAQHDKTMCKMEDNCKNLVLTSQPSVDHSTRLGDDDEQG